MKRYVRRGTGEVYLCHEMTQELWKALTKLTWFDVIPFKTDYCPYILEPLGEGLPTLRVTQQQLDGNYRELPEYDGPEEWAHKGYYALTEQELPGPGDGPISIRLMDPHGEAVEGMGRIWVEKPKDTPYILLVSTTEGEPAFYRHRLADCEVYTWDHVELEEWA